MTQPLDPTLLSRLKAARKNTGHEDTYFAPKDWKGDLMGTEVFRSDPIELENTDHHWLAGCANAWPALLAHIEAQDAELLRYRGGVQTHSPDCHTFGWRHYDCLLRKYEAQDKRIAAVSGLAEALQQILDACRPTVIQGRCGHSECKLARAALAAYRKHHE